MLTTKINQNNLKKKDIIKSVFKRIGISSFYSGKIINDIIYILISGLKSSKKIKIKKFGSFTLLQKKIRKGRNPLTKKEYDISKRLVVTFKPSEDLKKKIN